MKFTSRLVAAASAVFFIACSPALAQWQVPDHAVPIGRGAGTGFKSAAPGTAGQPLVSNGASSDPSFQDQPSTGITYTAPYSGGAAQTQSVYNAQRVSILDFGAICDGNIANAAANATALTNALATGKTVSIPWTSAGCHFGTNQITLGSGSSILGENNVLLKSTATTAHFPLAGSGITVQDISIDMTGSGGSSTCIRFGTSTNSISRVLLQKIRMSNCVEALGDEGTSFLMADLMFLDVRANRTRGRQIYFHRFDGFVVFRDVLVDFAGDPATTSYGAIQIDQVAGVEFERVDVTGWGLPANPAFNTNITAIILGTPANASAAIWLRRTFVDSYLGHGILIQNASYVFSEESETSLVLGNGIVLDNVSNGVFSNTVANGANGLPNVTAGAAGVVLQNGSKFNTFNGVITTRCSGVGFNVVNSNTNVVTGLISTDNTFPVALQGTSAKNVISGGQFSNNASAPSITTSGVGNILKDIPGYNPVGANATVTTTASPWTYTAGVAPETLYISSNTAISQVTQGGVSILPQSTGVNVNFTIQLGPGESAVVTYTGTLVAKKMVH